MLMYQAFQGFSDVLKQIRILKHPNASEKADGGVKPYIHGIGNMA